MVRNPDPKPGRWILPLVVLGMVFFTWAFVQRLEPDVIEDDSPISTTTTSAEGESEPDETGDEGDDAPAETTATTLPADLAAFLEDIVSDQDTIASVAVAMDAANAAWDNDEVGYGETEQTLIELRDDAAVFRDSVVLHQPPAGYSEIAAAYEDAFTAAEGIASAAEDVLAGLRASDTGQARRSALLDFRSSVETFSQAITAMQTAAGNAAG